MNGPVFHPGLAHPASRTAVPSAVSATMSANAVWLSFLLLWLCTAPTLSGTPFKHWYAFGLAAVAGIWCLIRIGSIGALLRQSIRPEHAILIAGLLGTFLSTATTPYPTQPADVFQLAREGYLVFVFGFLTLLAQHIAEGHLNLIASRFVLTFLCGAVSLCFLQQYSTWVFDFLLDYYYIMETSSAAGYMRNRPGLTFGNPNSAGMAICFVGIWGLTQPRQTMISTLGILVLSAAGILWTGSRTALFSYLASVCLITLIHNFRIAIGMLCLGIALFYLHPLIVNHQMSDWIDGMWTRVVTNRSSMDAREDIWMQLLVDSEWRYYSLFGMGPASEHLTYVDSAYVLALFRYGYVGLICYILWPIALCYHSWRNYSRGIQRDAAVRLAVMSICLLISSYAMAPFSDPRLGTLFLVVVATALCTEVSLQRSSHSAPIRPPHARMAVQSTRKLREPRVRRDLDRVANHWEMDAKSSS